MPFHRSVGGAVGLDAGLDSSSPIGSVALAEGKLS
jgi:hypothetical protein